MKKTTKIIIISVSALMIAALFLPTWDISLEAPQYPEGLGMQIWLNKITGDLNTINGLNHYIGMKKIEPDSIKELSIMPFILGFLVITGIAVGLSGRKKLLAVWVIIFVLLGAAGGYDFYMWEYDYGHDLNPEAAIKVPGMSYQPPLLGTKQLLNFTASSYPAEGGFIIIGAGIISLLALGYEIKFNKTKKEYEKNDKKDNAEHSYAGDFVHHGLLHR